MLYSLIDVGSNTVKFAVYSGKSPHPIYFTSKQIGLADYVQTENGQRKMSQSGVLALKTTLQEFKTLATEQGYPVPRAFCTEACRNLVNENEIVSAVTDSLGTPPDILSAHLEAVYTLQGVLASIPVSNGIMIDMGGASTEFCQFENKLPLFAPISIPCGCRHLYREYQETKSAESVLRLFDSRGSLPSFPPSLSLCLSGGSAKALENVFQCDQFPTEIKKDIPTLINYLLPILERADSPEDTLCRTAFGNRYPLMFPALTVFSTLIKRLSPQNVYLSKGGTREGYFLNMISNDQSGGTK